MPYHIRSWGATSVGFPEGIGSVNNHRARPAGRSTPASLFFFFFLLLFVLLLLLLHCDLSLYYCYHSIVVSIISISIDYILSNYYVAIMLLYYYYYIMIIMFIITAIIITTIPRARFARRAVGGAFAPLRKPRRRGESGAWLHTKLCHFPNKYF